MKEEERQREDVDEERGTKEENASHKMIEIRGPVNSTEANVEDGTIYQHVRSTPIIGTARASGKSLHRHYRQW